MSLGAVYCDTTPTMANGYQWTMRYNGNVQMHWISTADGDALLVSAAVSFATFDTDAATRLGAPYSTQTSPIRTALWEAAKRICP